MVPIVPGWCLCGCLGKGAFTHRGHGIRNGPRNGPRNRLRVPLRHLRTIRRLPDNNRTLYLPIAMNVSIAIIRVGSTNRQQIYRRTV
jgi:hypothetical protein